MRRGRRLRRPAFAIYALPVSSPLHPRIVVGQKVDKRAVVRNRARRRLREILRATPLPRVGLVVVARKPIVEITYAELRHDLTKLLAQLQ